MKVLAIHRFYWPDTPPYASILRTIVRRWVEDGHEVDVLSSQPSYKAGLINKKQESCDLVDGARVIRLGLPAEAGKPIVRMVNALRLGFTILWMAVIKNSYDVIMVSTSPPVLAGWFTALASKLSGARFVYHCMDIHPEIGRISGEFRNRWVFSLLLRLDNWACTQANPVVVLSDDMSAALSVRSNSCLPITKVINNFGLPSEDVDAESLPFLWPRDTFVILFAGNIGRFQGLDFLVEAMAKLSHRDDICLIMMGEGTEKERLQHKVNSGGANVTFVGHHSVGVAKLAMKQASVGFVSLIPELYRYAYPSKTMTYTVQGCPVLVAAEPDSCLVMDVVENEVGISVNNGHVDELVEAISTLAGDPDKVIRMRENALSFGSKEYSEGQVLDKWSTLLKHEVVN